MIGVCIFLPMLSSAGDKLHHSRGVAQLFKSARYRSHVSVAFAPLSLQRVHLAITLSELVHISDEWHHQMIHVV